MSEFRLESLNIKLIKNFQPDGFKSITKSDKIKLKESIKNGLDSPIYVWERDGEYLCLDGHHRLEVLNELNPDQNIQCLIVECKSEHEAKKKLLIYNSKYSSVMQNKIKEFVSDIDPDKLKNINLSNVKKSAFKSEDITRESKFERSDNININTIYVFALIDIKDLSKVNDSINTIKRYATNIDSKLIKRHG
jgi:hypothetical protein